jgi:hypothetical protein
VGVVGCGPDNRRANKKNDNNTRVVILLFRLEEEEKRSDRVVWVFVLLYVRVVSLQHQQLGDRNNRIRSEHGDTFAPAAATRGPLCVTGKTTTTTTATQQRQLTFG